MSTNASRKIATRWLSFYTYAYLPFMILFSFVPLLAQYDTLVELGYKVKLNPLMFVPIVVSDIFICFVIYGLHKKKFWGWVCNWIFLGAKVLLSPVYSTMSFGFGAYLVSVILLFLTFFLPNFIYFKKRRFLFEGTEKSSKTTDVETPAGQIESISPDAVRANGEGRGVSTESSAKPPYTYSDLLSSNIYRKEIAVSIKVALAMIAFTGAIIMIGIIFFFVTTKNNNSNQGTFMTWEQYENKYPNQDTDYPFDEAASSPNTREPYYNSGVEYEKKVQDPNAVEDYYTARDPENAEAFYYLGKLYASKKEYAKAIQAYDKAIDLAPSSPHAFFNLGFLYYDRKDYSKAEAMFLKVTELQPAYLDEAYFNLAVVQNLRGKKEESIGNLERALEVNPNNDRAKKYLLRLRRTSNTGTASITKRIKQTKGRLRDLRGRLKFEIQTKGG